MGDSRGEEGIHQDVIRRLGPRIHPSSIKRTFRRRWVTRVKPGDGDPFHGTAPSSPGIRVDSNNLQAYLRFKAYLPGKHQAHKMEPLRFGASHDRTQFGNIRHRDRPLRHRLGRARHQRGATADGERGQDPRTDPPALWRPRGSAAVGAGPERDRRHRRTARGQAERSCRRRARSRAAFRSSTAASTTSPAPFRRARR